MTNNLYQADFEYVKNEPIEANFELLDTKPFEANLIVDAVVEDKHYTHEQAVASTEWVVHHNLHKKCSITVVDSAGNVHIPDDEVVIDKDTVILRFLSAFAGEAYFN